MNVDSEALFGWLDDNDRRVIRSLRNSVEEGITQEELPVIVFGVKTLLDDPRNAALIQEAMPEAFLGFQQKVWSFHPAANEIWTMRAFMSLRWLSVASRQYPKVAVQAR